MQPTEILMNEHRIIEQVLACLEKMADRCAASDTLDVESVEAAIDFFRVFADRCHHGKEEDLLFPAMESKGFSPEQGPTGVMRHEHDEGRRHIAAIENSIATLTDDNAAACGAFVQHARDFVRLLRQHIEKEDHCLFPMANQALAATEQQQLLEAFQDVKRQGLEPDTHAKYVAIANGLADQYGVPRSSAAE